jgi:hypothetical protein
MIRPLRGTSRFRAAFAGAVLVTALAAGIPAALGQFSDAAAVGTNSFTTATCWSAVKTLQKGTATSSGNGTVTVAITAVDPAKSFLIFNLRSNSPRPVGSGLAGRLASSTTLEFWRVTDETSTIQIQWYVVEYACGVNVQRGATTLAGMANNVAITPVSALSRAFVTWSKTANAADASTDQNDTIVADLTTTSNLQLRVNTAASGHTVWWQVIEYTSAADINVQKGTTSMLGTALTATATLSPAVATTQTFVLASFQTSGTGTDMGARLLRAELTNSTTITFTRAASGTPDDLTEIHWQAVTLTGAAVRRGVANFGSGTTQVTPSFGSVDTSKSVAFASGNTAGGLSGGSSPYVTDDVPGVASFTADITSATTVRLERANTAATADVGWFVVQFR